MEQPFPALLMQAVGNSFCRVNGAAAADTDDGVDRGVLLNEFSGFVELRDRCVFPDFTKCAHVFGAEQLFDLLDEGGFGCERVAGDDEGFGAGLLW